MAEASGPRLNLATILKWHVELGIDEAIGEEAIDRFALPPPLPPPRAAAAAATAAVPRVATPLRPAQPPAAVPARAPVPIESPQLV